MLNCVFAIPRGIQPGRRSSRPAPDTGLEFLPEMEVPVRVDNDLSPLDEELLNALIESADYGKRAPGAREGSAKDFTLAPPEDIVESFRATWDRLVAELDLALGSDAALEAFRDLVVYDIPDGTRSTLTVPPTMA